MRVIENGMDKIADVDTCFTDEDTMDVLLKKLCRHTRPNGHLSGNVRTR
jgi:hypothetical protein